MKFVVDANVVISAAITPGKTREILVLSEADFLAPPELETEVRSYSALLAEKSGLSESAVNEILETLFDSVGTVSYDIPPASMRKARQAIGEKDPNDVPYLATAIAVDRAPIWSDDDVFGRQHHVECYTTSEMVARYEDGALQPHQGTDSRSQE